MTTAPTDSAITETADAVGIRSSALLGPLTYQPEIWPVEKDTIYAAIPAVESGLEYARECLATHESALGRTTLKNKTWAETMEKDIRHMERTLEMLRACRPNVSHQSRRPAGEELDG